METFSNIENYFIKKLEPLKCEKETKAYIASIFSKYKSSDLDLSDSSITVIYADAKQNVNFSKFQNLGDWIFFSLTIHDKHLQFASKDYYQTVAKMSYLHCFRLLNKQWKLFEELSDNFEYLEQKSRKLIIS